MFLKKSLMLSGIVILAFSGSNVLAASTNTQNVDISPIFTQEDGMWYPGRIESKDFNLQNNKSEKIKVDKLYMKFKSCKKIGTDENLNILDKEYRELVTKSTVKVTYKDKVLLEENLENLLFEKGIVLKEEIEVAAKEKVLLNMTINMDENMGNDTQNIESIFKVGVSYKVDSDQLGSIIDGNNGNKDEGNKGNLPQTGGLINSTSLLTLGSIVVISGIALNKKSSNNKGGKDHE